MSTTSAQRKGKRGKSHATMAKEKGYREGVWACTQRKRKGKRRKSHAAMAG